MNLNFKYTILKKPNKNYLDLETNTCLKENMFILQIDKKDTKIKKISKTFDSNFYNILIRTRHLKYTINFLITEEKEKLFLDSLNLKEILRVLIKKKAKEKFIRKFTKENLEEIFNSQNNTFSYFQHDIKNFPFREEFYSSKNLFNKETFFIKELHNSNLSLKEYLFLVLKYSNDDFLLKVIKKLIEEEKFLFNNIVIECMLFSIDLEKQFLFLKEKLKDFKIKWYNKNLLDNFLKEIKNIQTQNEEENELKEKVLVFLNDRIKRNFLNENIFRKSILNIEKPLDCIINFLNNMFYLLFKKLTN